MITVRLPCRSRPFRPVDRTMIMKPTDSRLQRPRAAVDHHVVAESLVVGAVQSQLGDPAVLGMPGELQLHRNRSGRQCGRTSQLIGDLLLEGGRRRRVGRTTLMRAASCPRPRRSPRGCGTSGGPRAGRGSCRDRVRGAAGPLIANQRPVATPAGRTVVSDLVQQILRVIQSLAEEDRYDGHASHRPRSGYPTDSIKCRRPEADESPCETTPLLCPSEVAEGPSRVGEGLLAACGGCRGLYGRCLLGASHRRAFAIHEWAADWHVRDGTAHDLVAAVPHS
jgi:hypothetical protein